MRLLSLFLILFSIPVFGQDYFGEDVSKYEGKKLTLKPAINGAENVGLLGFYKAPKKRKSDIPDVIFPISVTYASSTSYTALAKKIFSVDSISIVPGTEYDYNFKLSNPEIGSFYYHYNAITGEHTFPFRIITGDTLPLSDCELITSEIDKFTGEKKFYFYSNNITIMKSIKSAKTYYYMGLYAVGATPSYGKGVTILLEDGSKINKPNEKIDVQVNSSAQFEHSVFIQLTAQDIQAISQKKISDFRVYIYDQSVQYPDDVQKAIQCLLKMK